MVKLSKEARKVLEKLHKSGYSAYAVGGCVRDSLLGKVPYDFDITTSARPQQVKELFDRTIDTGIKHGTVTVMVNSVPIEVTTYRADGEYINNRKPETVTLVSDVREDLARRDFTVNALCYNDSEGILDFFGGMNDLNDKIIRAVGEPAKRFTEDALRMLRAVRFSAQLGFIIEGNTKIAISECAHLVKNLSVERIAAELDKILMSDSPQHIKLLYDLGILEHIMPEMCDCFHQEQNTRWHLFDVGTHSVNVIKNCPKVIYLRYAALMHDWGKPHTHGINDLGEDMFRNHAKISEELAESFCRKYKFSNELRDKIVRLVRYHDIEILPEKKYVKRAINKIGDDIFYDLICLKKADCLSQNLELTASRLPYIDRLFSLYAEIKENQEPFGVKNLAINGNDLKEIGIFGKEIGEVLNALLEKVIENPELNEKETLIEIVKNIK